MDTDDLCSQLSRSHGVAIEHSSQLEPPKLTETLALFGKLSYSSSFILQNGHFITCVFFSSPESCAACYKSLLTISHRDQAGVIQVGWVAEDSLEVFDKRCDVASRWKKPEIATAECGYLIAYWSKAPPAERKRVEDVASTLAVETFQDAKEGGRLFLMLKDENVAEDARRKLVELFPFLARCLEYCESSDYEVAKNVLVGQQ